MGQISWLACELDHYNDAPGYSYPPPKKKINQYDDASYYPSQKICQ